MAAAWGSRCLMLSRRRGVCIRVSGSFLPRHLALIFLVLAVSPPGFCQQKLETPQETNDRIRRLVTGLPGKPGDAVIGSGDLLHVEVFDVAELTRDVRVGDSGFISMPLLPVRVRAAGLTAFQLEEKLAELLQVNGLVSHPQVSVSVKEQHSQPITVIGAVKRPMVYQALRQTTLLQVLSEAGGIADDAGSTVIVSRNATPAPADEPESSGGSAGAAAPVTVTIDLNELLESGDSKSNIV